MPQTFGHGKNAMTVHNIQTLAPLMEAYEKAVVFEESVPCAFRLAKLFLELQRSNGGLVLFGVGSDGSVVGVDLDAIDETYVKFERLCRELTETRVEIGTLFARDGCAVFLVFNTIPPHTDPLAPYAGDISRVEMI
ncbi:MAG: hypothetical protein AAF357_08320 [Verrucomicrobiota bacterium]